MSVVETFSFELRPKFFGKEHFLETIFTYSESLVTFSKQRLFDDVLIKPFNLLCDPVISENLCLNCFKYILN